MQRFCCKTLQSCVFSLKTGVPEGSAGPCATENARNATFVAQLLHIFLRFLNGRWEGWAEGRTTVGSRQRASRQNGIPTPIFCIPPAAQCLPLLEPLAIEINHLREAFA